MGAPFTLEEIEEAHKGTNQDTVGKYLRDLWELGVVSFTTHISDGHSDYFDADGNILSSAAVHEPYAVADEANRGGLSEALRAHGRRETDYFTFVRQLADAGVHSWVMDTALLTITYRSKAGEDLLVDSA